MPEFTNKKRYDCLKWNGKNAEEIIKRVRAYYTVVSYINLEHLIIVTAAKTIILHNDDWVICSYKDEIDTRNKETFYNEFNQVK